MAIIIPSKNIYEINNQKVVDNEVDNIEVGAKNVVPDNHYSEPVYQESIRDGFFEKSELVSDDKYVLRDGAISPMAPQKQFYVSGVCANAQYYFNKTIYVPFSIDNTHILNGIILGTDNNGNTNISYSCSGKILTGHTNAGTTVTVMTNSLGTAVESSYAIFLPPTREEDYFLDKEESGTYTIPKEETNHYEDSEYNVEAKIDIKRKDNLATVEATEETIDGKEYLKIEIKDVLCGIRIIKSSGSGTAVKNAALGDRFLSGTIYNQTYTQYIPQQVSVTVYGNTIGIDLQDETIKIGNGQHIYSFSGNELIQTDNSPTTKETYEKVLNDWQNGKEVATIKCAIVNYYEDAEKQIVRKAQVTYAGKTNYNLHPHQIYYNQDIDVGDRIINERLNLTAVMVAYAAGGRFILCRGSVDASVSVGQTEDVFVIKNTNFAISPTKEYDCPMIFHIGDVVIPYVMGADKQDKPMSKYPDGSPKNFILIGQGLVADGEIAQNITMQEIQQTHISHAKEIIVIRVGGEIRGSEETSYIEMFVLYGTVQAGDVLEYNNEMATVFEYDGNYGYYELRISTGGEFYKNIGKVIAVTKRNNFL